MIFTGVLNKQTITEQTKTRLVLRELPLAEWLLAGVVFIVAANMAIFEFWITAIAAVIIGIVIVAQARLKYFVFDAATGMFTIRERSLLQQRTVNSIELDTVKRAYLRKDEGGSTQVILVDVLTNEMGLSVYSQDIDPWKEDIVVAINAFLHEYRKQQEDDDADGNAATVAP